MASIIQVAGKWRAQVRRKGVKAITKTFATKSAAQAWARRIEADVEAGTHRSASGRPLAELIDKYKELREGSGRPVRDDSNQYYMLRRLAVRLGEYDAVALDTERLLKWAQERKKEGAGPYTLNMELSLLGTVLRTMSSVLSLRLPDVVGEARPSLKHFHLIGGGGKRERRPEADELRRLFEYWKAHPEIGPPMQDIVSLAIVIGLRRGEFARIEWPGFDRERRMILVCDRKDPQHKSGNDQWVPLIGDAFGLLDKQPRRDGEPRIFPWNVGTISKYFTDACRELCIPDLHFHDCRHEAVSALLEAGWMPHEVALVSGHRSIAQLDRYANLRPDDIVNKVTPISKAKRSA